MGQRAQGESRDKSRDIVEQFLKSRDLLERIKGVELLRERGDKGRLLALLYSDSWHVRERAAQVLATFGDLVEADILPMLNEGYWYVRAAAAYVAGEIQSLKAVPTLLKLLHEKNYTVRNEAARALAKILARHPELYNDVDPEHRVLLENLLKSLKAFDLLEAMRNARAQQGTS